MIQEINKYTKFATNLDESGYTTSQRIFWNDKALLPYIETKKEMDTKLTNTNLVLSKFSKFLLWCLFKK